MAIESQRYVYAGEIRAAAILTTSYVEASLLPNDRDTDVSQYNSLKLNVDFTLGSLTNCTLKIEYADEIDDFYQTVATSTTTGVVTPSAETYVMEANFKGALLVPLFGKYVKVSAIGTGTVTGSSLKLSAGYGIK